MTILFDWKLAVFSFLTGAVLGAIFSLLKLPVPAPAILEGAIGVVGTCFGGLFLGPYIRQLIEKVLAR